MQARPAPAGFTSSRHSRASSAIVIRGSRDLGEGARARRGIGYVIQEIGLLPHRTIRQNVADCVPFLTVRTSKLRHPV